MQIEVPFQEELFTISQVLMFTMNIINWLVKLERTYFPLI